MGDSQVSFSTTRKIYDCLGGDDATILMYIPALDIHALFLEVEYIDWKITRSHQATFKSNPLISKVQATASLVITGLDSGPVLTAFPCVITWHFYLCTMNYVLRKHLQKVSQLLCRLCAGGKQYILRCNKQFPTNTSGLLGDQRR